MVEYLIFIILIVPVMYFLFYLNPYYCLYFFIIWLPLQNFILSQMSISGIFGHQIIFFLTSIKEIALLILLLTLLNKKLIFKSKFSIIDRLLLYNVIFILIYFILPSSFFGVPNTLSDRIYGLRFSLVSLGIFVAGRSIPYSEKYITKGIKLLIVMCVIIGIFGLFETIFIPRKGFTESYIQYLKIKGDESVRFPDLYTLMYIVDFSGIKIKRMMSFFMSPLGLSYFLIFPFTLIMSFLKRHIKGKDIAAYLLPIFILVILTILFSNTRAVIIALLFTAFLFFVKSSKKTLFLYSIVIIVIFIFTRNIFIDTYNLEDPSSAAHAYAYAMGVIKVLNHPLGIGLGQAGPVAVQMGASGIMGKQQASVGESFYLSTAMERGIPGLLLLLFFISSIIYASKEMKKNETNYFKRNLCIAIYLSTIAFLIASITTEVWFGFQSSAIYWWFAGIVAQLFSKYKLSNVNSRIDIAAT